MRRILLASAIIFFLTTACAPRRAQAQFIGYTSPQTVQVRALNAVSAPATAVVPNVGQSTHFLSYTLSGNCAGAILITIDASNDGVNFQRISADGVDIGTSGAGLFAAGYFAVVRVNLVTFTCAAPAPTLTAFYSGTSGAGGNPFGVFTQNNNARMVVAQNQSTANFIGIITSPSGSTGGRLYVQCVVPATQVITACPVGFQFQVNPTSGAATSAPVTNSFSVANSSGTQTFDLPSIPASGVTFSFTGGGAGTNFYAYFHFAPATRLTTAVPIQGLVLQNSESVSAANTAVTKSIAAAFNQQVFLYSVSARCSAGTASLTVKDGVAGTTIWTSAAAEVGTTSFKFQWNPGLASSSGNGMDITLGTCGVGNTGTLDVQASQL